MEKQNRDIGETLRSLTSSLMENIEEELRETLGGDLSEVTPRFPPEEIERIKKSLLETLRVLGYGGKTIRVPATSKESEIARFAVLEMLRRLGYAGKTVRVPARATSTSSEKEQLIQFVTQKILQLRESQSDQLRKYTKSRVLSDPEVLKKAKEQGISFVVLEHVIYPKAFLRARAIERSKKKAQA